MKRKQIEYLTMVILMVFFLLTTFLLGHNGIKALVYTILAVYTALSVSMLLTGYKNKKKGSKDYIEDIY